jgi:hypothetical protein
MQAKDLSLEELKDYKEYCTIGQLLDFINEYNLPRDNKVLVERVEDVYYEEHGWKTVKKEEFMFWSEMELINKAKSGGFNNKEDYPLMTEEKINNIIEMEKTIDGTKNEYHPVFSPVKYKDDDNLYLDLHY